MSTVEGSGSTWQSDFNTVMDSLKDLESACPNFLYDKENKVFVDPLTISEKSTHLASLNEGLKDITQRVGSLTKQLMTEIEIATGNWDQQKIALLKQAVTDLNGLIKTSSFSEITKEPSRELLKLDQLVTKAEKEITQVHRSATTIQKVVRGRDVRKAHLPAGFHGEYESITAKTVNMKKAMRGKTRVYLPDIKPDGVTEVVLKDSGRNAAIERFHKMQFVRSVLKSQKSTSLIIPKARLYENFIIEERLPINADTFHNMGLYLSNPHLFDTSAREMVRLFSKISFTDLINWSHPLAWIPGGGGCVRYDNLPFYVVENRGMIGFVDLEHVEERKGEVDLKTLVRIFPYNKDVILEEADKLGIKYKLQDIEEATNQGKNNFQLGYVDHLKWFEEKGITFETASQIPEIDEAIKDKLTHVVEVELTRLNNGDNDYLIEKRPNDIPKFFFKEPSQDAIKELSPKICELILKGLITQLKKHQQKWLKDVTQVKSEAEMIALRSPLLKRNEIYEDVLDEILEHPQCTGSSYDLMDSLEDPLLTVVMNELVKSKVLFYFDPAYYTSGHRACFVRY